MLFALWMAHLFGSVGRHRWIDAHSFVEEDDGESRAAVGQGGGAPTKSGGEEDVLRLLTLFERSAGARAIDAHRLDSLLLVCCSEECRQCADRRAHSWEAILAQHPKRSLASDAAALDERSLDQWLSTPPTMQAHRPCERRV